MEETVAMARKTFDTPWSSAENVSADVKLSLRQKLQWLWRCRENNSAPLADVDPRIEFAGFNAKVGMQAEWGSPPSSPSRFLCNAFWSELDLSPLFNTQPVRALEIGCGSGVYGLKLREKLGDNLASYRGVDIVEHREWQELRADSRFDFSVGRAENIRFYLTGANLVFTQSAIEHFERDLEFFRPVAEYVSGAAYPVWQVHLMPSAECLQTYLWHGHRQYTPKTVSRITRLFSSDAKFEVYILGGRSSNNVHKRYVTVPTLLFGTDLREKAPVRYMRAAVKAIQEDQNRRDRIDASFYALLIKSNCGC